MEGLKKVSFEFHTLCYTATYSYNQLRIILSLTSHFSLEYFRLFLLQKKYVVAGFEDCLTTLRGFLIFLLQLL